MGQGKAGGLGISVSSCLLVSPRVSSCLLVSLYLHTPRSHSYIDARAITEFHYTDLIESRRRPGDMKGGCVGEVCGRSVWAKCNERTTTLRRRACLQQLADELPQQVVVHASADPQKAKPGGGVVHSLTLLYHSSHDCFLIEYPVHNWGRSSANSFTRSLARSLARSFARSLVRSFVRLFVYSFIRLFALGLRGALHL